MQAVAVAGVLVAAQPVQAVLAVVEQEVEQQMERQELQI
jgi:hypothetical protein